MALVGRLQDRSTYLDTNIFIYALESYTDVADMLRELFEAVDGGAFRAVTSELTLAEALVKPMVDRHLVRQARYQETIVTAGGLEVVPVSRSILIESARWRASLRVALPDAIHVATAIAAGCDAFLTNDDRLKGLPIEVIRLADLA